MTARYCLVKSDLKLSDQFVIFPLSIQYDVSYSIIPTDFLALSSALCSAKLELKLTSLALEKLRMLLK